MCIELQRSMDLKTKLATAVRAQRRKDIHILILSSGFILFTSASKLSFLRVYFDQTQNDIHWNSHLLQNAQNMAKYPCYLSYTWINLRNRKHVHVNSPCSRHHYVNSAR